MLGGITFTYFVGEFNKNGQRTDLVSVDICNSASFIFP